jgi:cyclophilin family peptidyl-prolyl cis-trans isomerase
MRALLLFVLFASACGGSGPATFDFATPYVPAGYSMAPFFSDTPIHSFTAAGQALDAGEQYEVVLETDVGIIVLGLDPTDAPLATNSMVWLARNHFYDGIAFHRVIDDFVAQAGDPNSLGSDTSTWGLGGAGYTFALEVAASATFDAAGVLGMARGSDPSSNSSQFFITLDTQPSLDEQYTVFGKVVEGLDVLPKIVRGEPPTHPTRILAAYAVERAEKLTRR